MSTESRYHVIGKIGEGTYGTVLKAIDLQSKCTVALKKMRIDLDEEGIPPTALRECAVLKALSHPNVIKLHDVVHRPHSLYLVFECADTDLKQHMDSQICALPLATVRSFVRQLLEGVAYCHSRRVLHRDIKPNNILLDLSNGTLLLADFGLSTAFRMPNRSLTHDVVTLWYRAPEILLGAAQYSTAVDLWSVGCILGELLRGKPLFAGETEIDQLFQLFSVLGTPSEQSAPSLTALPAFQADFPKWRPADLHALVPGAPPEAIDLLMRLFAYEPSERPSARTALLHPFFAQAADEPQQGGAEQDTAAAQRAAGGLRNGLRKAALASTGCTADCVPEHEQPPAAAAGTDAGARIGSEQTGLSGAAATEAERPADRQGERGDVAALTAAVAGRESCAQVLGELSEPTSLLDGSPDRPHSQPSSDIDVGESTAAGHTAASREVGQARPWLSPAL